MTITKSLKWVVIISLLILVNPPNVLALSKDERIVSYDSDIVINDDRSLVVTEKIKVYANGNEIKRGIYRDYPLSYKDKNGFSYNIGFDILKILRDDDVEDYHTEKLSNGIRIYIGNKDVYLDPGFYTYTIKYRTDRQIGFFRDHDELYYNATGNGWDFVIENAAAVIQLPSGVNQDQVQLTAYTGYQRSVGKDFEQKVYRSSGHTYASFKTTKPLSIDQGLTIVVGWPKGFIPEPTIYDRVLDFIFDNFFAIMGLLLLPVILAYFYIVWIMYGRDPDSGVVIPEYDAPEGISPAGVRYINRMGFDNKGITAALVDMATKGYLRIIEKGGDFTIELLGRDTDKLSEDEKVLADSLFSHGVTKFTFEKSKASKISKSIKYFQKSLKKEYFGLYFKNNRRYLVPPIIITIVYVVSTILAGQVGFILVVVIIIVIILHIIFGVALKVRTVSGAEVQRRILGLKKFLTTVEERRYQSKLHKDIPHSLKIYERYLPHAIALDVEPVWTERFRDEIAKAQVIMEDGTKASGFVWYAGSRDFSPTSISHSLGNSLTGVIASSSTPPGSSSGSGGGGFSGGGGGGGGGGGW